MCREPPHVCLAPTALWRVPPLATGGPFPQVAGLTSPPSLSLFPLIPIYAPGGGGPGWCGGGVLGRGEEEGGGGGVLFKRHLGPDPHLDPWNFQCHLHSEGTWPLLGGCVAGSTMRANDPLLKQG